ncbi:FecR/PupR family sigma factor regulator [Microbulbifer litoralis]|uniref:FecR/PupR family sigma factor regulator n=1 Tax=Microbulbifer litoralis TaxID=2933965 RepID=UPI002027FC18|nr:FecR/PupR family sigma factor regulator [Microbulbifer sp. GX H0434]
MQLDEWLCIGIPEDVLEQASAWLARLDADHVSLDERQRLSVWLDEDPLHRWAFEELSQLYARAATLSQVRGQIAAPRVLMFPQPAPVPAPASPTPTGEGDTDHTAPRPLRWQPVVALVLIAIGLVLSQQPAQPAAAQHEHSRPIDHNLINGD